MSDRDRDPSTSPGHVPRDGASGALTRPSARIAGLVLAALLAVAGGAVAAENVHDPYADPDEVNATEKVKHTFGYTVDNVSNDGNEDALFLTFRNDITAANLSSWSGNVTDEDTRESISISSSPSIVDGPDGDGVKETVKIGVQSEGEKATRDLIVNFTGYVTWPDVAGTQDLPVNASVTDSKRSDIAPPETFAHVTVVGGPAVETREASHVGTPSPPLHGEVTDLAGAEGADAWFAYWVEGDRSSTLQETSKQTLSSAGSYQATVDGLQEDTPYVVEARLETSGGESDTGSQVPFATDAPLAVATDDATDVGTTSATLGGEVTGTGGADTVDAWFAYWVEGDRSSTLQETSKQTLSSTGTYEATVDGLQEGTTYVVEARAEAGDASATGSQVTFATSAESADAVARLHSGSVTPGTVDAGAKVQHTFTYRIDNVSNEGSSVTLYLTLADAISADDLSSFSGEVSDAETGASVSISSSPSIVDGPDGDGIQETVKIGVQPSGEEPTRDLDVTFTGDVTWPAVDRTRDLPVKAAVVDSVGDDVEPPLEVAAVTVSTELQAATDEATAVGETEATLHGSVPSFGAEAPVTARFAYWVQGDEAATRTETDARTLQDPGSYQADVAGLEPGTTYVFQALASDATGGSAQGETVTFATASAAGGDAPVEDVDEGEMPTGEDQLVWDFWAARTVADEDCAYDRCGLMTRDEQAAGDPVRMEPGDRYLWIGADETPEAVDPTGGEWTLRLHCTEQATGTVGLTLAAVDDEAGDGLTALDSTRITTERCEGEDSDVKVAFQPDPDEEIPAGSNVAVRVAAYADAVYDVHAKGEAPDTQLASPTGALETPGAGFALLAAAFGAAAVGLRRTS